MEKASVTEQKAMGEEDVNVREVPQEEEKADDYETFLQDEGVQEEETSPDDDGIRVFEIDTNRTFEEASYAYSITKDERFFKLMKDYILEGNLDTKTGKVIKRKYGEVEGGYYGNDEDKAADLRKIDKKLLKLINTNKEKFFPKHQKEIEERINYKDPNENETLQERVDRVFNKPNSAIPSMTDEEFAERERRDEERQRQEWEERQERERRDVEIRLRKRREEQERQEQEEEERQILRQVETFKEGEERELMGGEDFPVMEESLPVVEESLSVVEESLPVVEESLPVVEKPLPPPTNENAPKTYIPLENVGRIRTPAELKKSLAILNYFENKIGDTDLKRSKGHSQYGFIAGTENLSLLRSVSKSLITYAKNNLESYDYSNFDAELNAYKTGIQESLRVESKEDRETFDKLYFEEAKRLKRSIFRSSFDPSYLVVSQDIEASKAKGKEFGEEGQLPPAYSLGNKRFPPNIFSNINKFVYMSQVDIYIENQERQKKKEDLEALRLVEEFMAKEKRDKQMEEDERLAREMMENMERDERLARQLARGEDDDDEGLRNEEFYDD